jgi:hypothetical protein
MQEQDTGLRAQIKNASKLVQDAASKSEAAALDAVARTETALASAKTALDSARQFSGEVANSVGHAGRTSFNGVVEFNTALGRYGKEALTDTIEAGRKSINAKSAKEVVEIYVDYVARRGQALFSHVGELNALAQSKTVDAWAPLGDTLRKAGEKTAA